MHDRQRQAFWRGARDGLPFLIVIVPFGMLFGVVAHNAGWPLSAILGMNVLVIAGASQFTALQLLAEQAPLPIVIFTSLAVNLRLAMYSASLAPHVGATPRWIRALIAYFLTDQTYGIAIRRFSTEPEMSVPERIAYYFGVATPICGPWYLAAWAGVAAGAAIPAGLAIDFAVPVTFIALVAPALRNPAHLAAATVSVVLSLALYRLPFNLWLMIAAPVAMVTGALVEAWRERRS